MIGENRKIRKSEIEVVHTFHQIICDLNAVFRLINYAAGSAIRAADRAGVH